MATTATIENKRAFNNRLATVQANIMRILRRVRAESHTTTLDIYESVGREVITNPSVTLTGRDNRKVETRLENLVASILPVYVEKDRYMRRAVNGEYNNNWYRHFYELSTLANEPVRFNPSKKVRERALNNQLNILVDSQQLRARRRSEAIQIAQTIRRGISQNATLDEVTRRVDIVLGFRTRDGKISPIAERKIAQRKLIKRGGQIYQSQRIARTEMARMRGIAATDALQTSRARGWDERLQLLAVIDSRTRPQSAQMDGQVSNENGQFRYPDGRLYYFGSQPIQWLANDREDVVSWLPEIPDPEERTFRTPDGTVMTGPYRTFREYAESTGIFLDKVQIDLSI